MNSSNQPRPPRPPQTSGRDYLELNLPSIKGADLTPPPSVTATGCLTDKQTAQDLERLNQEINYQKVQQKTWAFKSSRIDTFLSWLGLKTKQQEARGAAYDYGAKIQSVNQKRLGYEESVVKTDISHIKLQETQSALQLAGVKLKFKRLADQLDGFNTKMKFTQSLQDAEQEQQMLSRQGYSISESPSGTSNQPRTNPSSVSNKPISSSSRINTQIPPLTNSGDIQDSIAYYNG